MYRSIFTWATLLLLTWQIFNYKHGSSNFLPGDPQAYMQYIYTDDFTIFTSKINNIYVDASFSFCLLIFVWTRFKFLYNRVNFQINMSFCQLTQHGFIRHMRNDIHKYLQVLEQTNEVTFQNNLPGASTGLKTKIHEVTFQNNLPGTSTGLRTIKPHKATFQNNLLGASTGRRKKHMKWPFKTICLVLP